MTGPGGWFIDEDLLGLAHVLAAARRHLEDVHYPGDATLTARHLAPTTRTGRP
ncbi:MAG: hypothetical protein ACR2HR_11090 [Euzebya sp.]